MKRQAIYTLLLSAALLLSVSTAPIPSHTAARLDEPYTSGGLIGVTFKALGHGQNPLDFASAIAPLYDSGTSEINGALVPGEALVPASVYTLTVATDGTGSGTVDPAVGTHTYISGTTVILTATANTGSMFMGWSGDATGMTNPVTVTMDSDKIVMATFDLILSYVFLQSWGNEGSEDGQFSYPSDITVDAGQNGNVYVADTGNHRIQKFTSNGTFLTGWGEYGSGDGQFNAPCGIAVDGSGNVYVADASGIQKFVSDGTFLTRWEGGAQGIAVDDSGNVYVADEYGGCDIALDDSGNIYVVDCINHCVKKLAPDGAFLVQWGGYGNGDGQFNSPRGIAVHRSGNVYVADTGNHRIQKFTSDGIFLTKWGSEGGGDGQFISPHGVAVDGGGNVYVADTGNDRIQKFAPNLLQNGSFEEMPALVGWTYGGELPVGLVNDAVHGSYAVQLGEPVSATVKDQGIAWLRQTMYIPPEWERPVLTFHYRLFANDIIDYSDFHVSLTTSNGTGTLLAEIKRDGFRSCCDPPQVPPPGHDLGWRMGYYDLSDFKGQTVRLVFENRYLYAGYSLGIWTYVDDVRVVDAGPLPTPPGPPRAYLPVIMNGYATCDPVVACPCKDTREPDDYEHYLEWPPLELGMPVDGYICHEHIYLGDGGSAEYDWYWFVISSPCDITVDLKVPRTVDYDLIAWDGFEWLISKDPARGVDEHIEWTAEAIGMYMVGVRSLGDSDNHCPYTLHVRCE